MSPTAPWFAGGFRVLPDRVEFWQESPAGLHDRIRIGVRRRVRFS